MMFSRIPADAPIFAEKPQIAGPSGKLPLRDPTTQAARIGKSLIDN
jgi:hypothetical protein